MSDGEPFLHGGIDTDPEAEARAAAAQGETLGPMPSVIANRDAPEGIAPARVYGGSGLRVPDGPHPDSLTAHGLEAIGRLAAEANLPPLRPDRYLDR